MTVLMVVVNIPLDIDFNVTKKELIKAGEHHFLIQDLEILKPEGQDFEYLHFDLLDVDTNESYKNLLSAPLPRHRYYDNSRFSIILGRLGLVKSINDSLTGSELNKLIGKDFTALVVFDSSGFAKIAENSISIVNPKSD